MKRHLLPFSLILLFLFMLLHPSEVFLGAQTGLLLWFRTVLPTLFPFMVISSLIIHTDTLRQIAKIAGMPFSRFFHVSKVSSFAILAGFLCGYPMGARITADLIETGQITQEEGGYLLSFCNNTSPAFLLSYVLLQHIGIPAFTVPSMVLLFLSPILCSQLFYICHYKGTFCANVSLKAPARSDKSFPFVILDDCIMKSIESIVQVGGYIILFSISIECLCSLSVISSWGKLLCSFALEITNGITLIAASGLPAEMCWLLSITLCSFGGLCAAAQTNCMIQHTSLSIGAYVIEKLITAIVTSLCAWLYLICLG